MSRSILIFQTIIRRDRYEYNDQATSPTCRAYAGERIFGSGVPIGGEDMYILGSSGKSMTSTMAARVVAKGYISWKTTTKEIFHDTVRGEDYIYKGKSRVSSMFIHRSKTQPWSLLSAMAVALLAWMLLLTSTMTWWVMPRQCTTTSSAFKMNQGGLHFQQDQLGTRF